MKQFFTVLSFEFNKMQKSNVFRIMTVVVLIVIIIGMSVPRILDLFNSNVKKPIAQSDKKIIYVIDNTAAANEAAFIAPLMDTYNWQSGDASAKTDIIDKINSDKAYALVEIAANGDAVLTTKEQSVSDTFSPSLQAILSQKHQIELMTQYGLTQEQVKQIYTPPAFEKVQSGKNAQSTFAFTYVLLILLFMSITMYGQMVTMSVITEKSTRTMELLVTSAKPDNLIFGKVIGTGLAGLAQLTTFLLALFVMYKINYESVKNIPYISTLFEGSSYMLFYTLIYYLLGFFLYAFLLGALGSLCSRVEDANVMVTPATLLLVAGFYIAIYGALLNPNSLFMVIASMIPFFSPMVMLVRMGMTDVPFWQVALSIVITGLGVYGMGKLSVMIYRIGVLIYGNKPSLKQILKTLRQAKTL